MKKNSNFEFFSENELFIIHNSLNEVCNALDVTDFETRMGSTREDALNLLQKINKLLSEKESE